jgi:hypothetical protein
VRGTALRWFAVIALGIALLAVVLYFASTVDGRPPAVAEYRLTQSLSTDASVALTTTSIEVSFSEEVEHAAAERAFGIEPPVAGAFSWSGSTMIFTPEVSLPLETAFSVTIETGIPDLAGNRMTDPAAAFDFRTVGPPRVIGVEPPDGSIDVALDAPITVTFSTLMDTTTVEAAISIRPSVPLQLAWRQEVLEITPLEPLQADRRYELIIDTDATDQGGTPLAERSSTSFTTVAAGLVVDRVVPADGVEGIAVGTSIAVQLDGEIDPSSLGDESLRITPDVAGTLAVVAPDGAAGMLDQAPQLLRFTPSGPLPPNTTFEVTLAAGLRSIDARVLARDVTWSFTTGAPLPTLANQILFLSDRSGITNLWAMNPDGSNERQLSAETSPVTAFAAAPDGRAFVTGDGMRLVMQRADGSDRRVLTDAGVLEFDPAYAPDGSALLSARADPATGSGLGIWRRADVSGAAERIDLAPDAEASPTPDPTSDPPVPLLRAPRYAPDGGQIAWIDAGGGVVILDVATDDRRRVPFAALEPPVWLPERGGLVVSGVAAEDAPRWRPAPDAPVAPLDAATAGASVIADLQIVRISDAGRVTPIEAGAGGARLAAGAAGRVAFVRLSAAGRAGTLWITNRTLTGASRAGAGDDRVARAAFAPDPDLLVIERVTADGRSGGLWQIDEASGRVIQLSKDGSQPRFLP